ncbi:hypothetical protein [Rhizobacter sp. Root404]|uniref:hypothetical protein n=1 Tax=Rhizobacter sp. Root404 TaxID=1736528 RepID=UPI000AB8B52C|nr:hypothetical protein [Rhizobacter sp. Root404]
MTDVNPLDQAYAERVLAEAAIAGLLDVLSGRVVSEEELDHLLGVTDFPGSNEP